jgi:hypothetical protein
VLFLLLKLYHKTLVLLVVWFFLVLSSLVTSVGKIPTLLDTSHWAGSLPSWLIGLPVFHDARVSHQSGGFLSHGGPPKSYMLFSDSPWNKLSSELGDPHDWIETPYLFEKSSKELFEDGVQLRQFPRVSTSADQLADQDLERCTEHINIYSGFINKINGPTCSSNQPVCQGFTLVPMVSVKELTSRI